MGLCALALLSVSAVLAERPDRAFRQGVQAHDLRDWFETERQMRRAIQLDSTESTRKISITGMRFESYLPYFYLGSALFHQGKHEAARDAWDESRRQGAVLRWRDSDRFHALWNRVVKEVGLPIKRRQPSRPAPNPRPEPPAPTVKERCTARQDEIRGLLERLGPPISPTAEAQAAARKAWIDVEIRKHANTVSDDDLEPFLAPLERAAADLKKATQLKARTNEHVLEDLKQLVERVRGSAGAEAPDDPEVAEALIQVEIQLGRNQPNLDVLQRQEAILLRFLMPSLKTEI